MDYPVERMAVATPLMVRWSGRRRAAIVSAFASADVQPYYPYAIEYDR
jgi:hypothetical protein